MATEQSSIETRLDRIVQLLRHIRAALWVLVVLALLPLSAFLPRVLQVVVYDAALALLVITVLAGGVYLLLRLLEFPLLAATKRRDAELESVLRAETARIKAEAPHAGGARE